MKTNDLKKGTVVLLRDGLCARMADNKKGNIRLATVFGFATEMGSVYSHDIVGYVPNSESIKDVSNISKDAFKTDIEYTDSQIKCRKMNRAMGF